MVKRWHKGTRPIRPMPKDRTKILAWGSFYEKGKTSLFCFVQIMNAQFYIEILCNHLPEIRAMLGDNWRFQQDNDDTSKLAKEFIAENTTELLG
ncbi:hypothetical protein G9A89_010209 [Geosiphon pyriformis]|nr:hypothetical protein G9A89_010209 [Geosiphon pyriformis]